MASSVGQEFVQHVNRTFTEKSLEFYRHDLRRLLLILRKTVDEESDEPWYARRYDPVSMHCEYMITKMSFDVRSDIRNIPNWLKSLAGHNDFRGNARYHQIAAFSQICGVLDPLVKKYGPDSHATLPPPPLQPKL